MISAAMFADDFPEQELDRFLAVESVAQKIFDAMPDLSHHDDAQEDAASHDPDTTRPETLLTRTERVLSKLVQVLDDRPTTAQNDISYRAARRRSQLPDGVELLEGAPSPASDDATMASIHLLIEEQEAEQYAVAIQKKREANRRALPPLEPQMPSPAPQVTERPKPPFVVRCRAALRHAFRKDFFLACALSVWSALAMAVFIEPSVTGKLVAASLFLLFVASCLFPEPETKGLRRTA